MKYDGSKYRKLASKFHESAIIPSKKKKKREVKEGDILSIKDSIKESLHPFFTIHSLQRLSERVQGRRHLTKIVTITGQDVYFQKPANWIYPELIGRCIDDLRSNIARKSLYSKQKRALIVRGNIAYYVVASDGAIITTYKKIIKGYYTQYDYKPASIKFVASFLSIKQIKIKNLQ